LILIVIVDKDGNRMTLRQHIRKEASKNLIVKHPYAQVRANRKWRKKKHDENTGS